MDMRDNRGSDKRYQISKNDEERLSDIIEYLKLGKLSSHKNLYNVEKEYDKINRMDVSDDKDSA